MKMGSCAKCCYLFFLLIAANSAPFTLGESTDDILQFLELNEGKIVLDPKHKDVVLVVGNTGVGKTAFTQWIAGDNSKLFSVEKDPGNFIIVDNNRIGNSTVQSKTTFPELVVDKETGTAYYDTSGFGDTRGVKNDIATSYFIKQIIDHVDRVKIILVTDYEAVRNGGSRKDFLNLLQHIVELIKNIDRYTFGVGLVVTKVPNLYSRGNLVSDDAIIQTISQFLDDFTNDIAERIDLDVDVCAKIIHLVHNIISENNVDEDSDIRTYRSEGKIMLFRRPNDTGPLSLINGFQQAKLYVRTIINEKLKYVTKDDEDFSYTVSAETKVMLSNVINVLKNKLEENLKTVVLSLKNHYENKINGIKKKLQTIHINDTEKAESVLARSQILRKNVNDEIKNLFTIASDMKNTKCCKEIAVIFNNTVKNYHLRLPQQIMSNIFSEASFLEFIDEASIIRFKFDITLLHLSLQEIANKLNESSIQVEQYIDRLSTAVEENIKKSFSRALTHLTEYISQTEKTSFDLAEIKTVIHKFYSLLIKLQETSNSAVKINQLLLIFKMSETKISDQVIQKIKDPKYDIFLTTEINLLVQVLNNSHAWYEFLDKLYTELSSYNVQRSTAVQSHCKYFVQSSANYQGRNVRDTNIDIILQVCSKSLYDTEFNQIKNIKLTQNNVEVLKNVVDFTLNNNGLPHHCSNSKLIVKGRFVKMSEVNLNFCNGISILEIVGMEKIFIDRDIDLTGRSIDIIMIAPHWVVIGDRNIHLDGKPGKIIQPMKAEEGQDGQPGMPGGNAGNFVGYADKITNSEKLFISANGGNGSPGQAGGDGKPGVNGAVPKIKYNSLDYWLGDSERNYNVEDWDRRNFKVSTNDQYYCGYIIYDCKDYRVTGNPCSDGGNGGRGGLGGEGGAGGVVLVPYLEFSAKNGKNGASGAPGKGAEAGDYSATISVREIIEHHIICKTKFYELTRIEYHGCSAGDTPHGSYNSVGMRHRTSPELIVFYKTKFSPTIDEFKSYLQQNLNKTFRKQYLLNILSQIHI